MKEYLENQIKRNRKINNFTPLFFLFSLTVCISIEMFLLKFLIDFRLFFIQIPSLYALIPTFFILIFFTIYYFEKEKEFRKGIDIPLSLAFLYSTVQKDDKYKKDFEYVIKNDFMEIDNDRLNNAILYKKFLEFKKEKGYGKT